MRLSVFDSNHHNDIGQTTDEFGDPMFTRRWSKKGGKWVPVRVPNKKGYEYIPYLMVTIFNLRREDSLPISRTIERDKEDPRRLKSSIPKLPPESMCVLAEKLISRF